MWKSFGLVTYLCYAILASTTSTGVHSLEPRNNVNITAFMEVPACATACGTRILAAFDCLPTDPCFCQTSGPQVDALAACLATSCTLEGALASQKLQAQTCEFPYHDKAPRIAKVSYSLFGVAMLFVIARFISRFRRLHGAGFGRDDFTVAFCVAPMAGMTVVAYFEDKYGTGRDVWTVPMSNLEPFALVSRSTYHVSDTSNTLNSGSTLDSRSTSWSLTLQNCP